MRPMRSLVQFPDSHPRDKVQGRPKKNRDLKQYAVVHDSLKELYVLLIKSKIHPFSSRRLFFVVAHGLRDIGLDFFDACFRRGVRG